VFIQKNIIQVEGSACITETEKVGLEGKKCQEFAK
jgi:hypothetical protein